jgi:hypothetical protein
LSAIANVVPDFNPNDTIYVIPNFVLDVNPDNISDAFLNVFHINYFAVNIILPEPSRRPYIYYLYRETF